MTIQQNSAPTQNWSAEESEFLRSVLYLEPRLAVFDCDGTLWSGDAGEGFFDWELQQGLVAQDVRDWARPRYADYKAGNVDEDTMCGEMVTLHDGLPEARVQQAADEFFGQHLLGSIFPVMRELVRRLQDSGCEVWAVSSSNEWIIRSGMRHFGIPPHRILAAAVEVTDGIVSGRLVRVPSGPGKPAAIQEVVQRIPDAAFGNSRWDAEMLQMARHAFAINPNPDLETAARAHGWSVFFPRPTNSR
jgi:phosphoserine phosphatase